MYRPNGNKGSIAVSLDNSTKPKTGVVEFARETRQEIAKVTWPSRRETMMMTMAIIVMALVAGVFFLAVDSGLGFIISRILGMHS